MHISLSVFTLHGWQHSSTKHFSLSLSLSAAAPSRPTRPELEERGPQSLSLSFSVKHGSYPIHYYLVLISELSDLTINQTTFDFTNTTERIANISSEDKNSVVGQEEWENEGEVVGYHASLKVRGLRPRQSYVFSVAAASVVGVGDFSEPSQPFTLEDGGMLYICRALTFMVHDSNHSLVHTYTASAQSCCCI